MKLRPYQTAACDKAIDWLKKTTSPCLIDAAPAAGKSFMIARIASVLSEISGGKRVLCLAPSAELVEQNHGKYLLTGEKASIFSASAGRKETRNIVVFGTPGTVKNSISRFLKDFCAVICDECHGITPTIRSIIDAMREANPYLRVVGLSGTPYRLGEGYVFSQWPDGKINDEGKAKAPYFTRCVYQVTPFEMLDAKFITPMTIGAINTGQYDTSGIQLLSNGMPESHSVEQAFEGHGRKTSAIVADVMTQAQGRPGGVMLFGATVAHAYEILASLPPSRSAIVTGDTPKGERRKINESYRKQQIRYLVSVGTLTTGFDVEHTEVIALLRYTESAALLQQIMGRAWRLHPAKQDSLLLDYAGNVERHFPDGDIYRPVINASLSEGSGELIEAVCPDCSHPNEFALRKDYEDFSRDVHGYVLDAFGENIMSEYGPVAAHYGRRCQGTLPTGPRGAHEQCEYYWTSKDCRQCLAKNDIAARKCRGCGCELIDPNDKLVADFKALKRDPTMPQTDEVVGWSTRPGVSKRGNRTIRVDVVTPYRQFSVWLVPDSGAMMARRKYAAYLAATEDGAIPATVSYRKDRDTGFFEILAYNRPADVEPVCRREAA